MYYSIISLSSFLAFTTAFTFTSPSSGSSLDPAQPITIQWTPSSSDPSTFNLILDSTNTYSLTRNKVIATSISTSSGSYTLSASTIISYGVGFIFKAQDSSGSVLDTSGTFTLAVDGSAVTTSNGHISFQSTYTATATGTGTGSNGGSSSATNGKTTVDSSIFAQTTNTASGTETTATNGFLTSTTTRASSSGSGTRSVASSAASATTSANAQPRIGGSSSQIAFSAAGILAGLVALLA